MTTSVSNVAVNASAEVTSEPTVAPAEVVIHRVRHTLPSRFIFLGLCLAIVLSALAFGTNHNWALAIFTFGGLAILFLWLLDGWKLGLLRISRNPLQLPLLGMLLLGLIQLLPLRSAEAVDLLSIPAVKSLSLDPYATTLIVAHVATILVYFSATLVFTDTPHRLRILVRTITIFGFMLAIFGLTQSFTTSKVFWVRELAQSTAFGPFINRHHFAGYMELTIALPLGMLFAGSLERDKRFAYIFAAVLMGVALVMTNSRGGVISLIAEILFLLVLSGFRKRKAREVEEKSQRIKRTALRAAFALSLIVALFAGVVLLGGESALSRFAGTVNSEDPTTGRAHFWNVTLDIIKSHPIVGTGLGAFPTVYTRYDSRNGSFRLEQAHNDYLQVMSDGGIIGAALALLFVVMLFRYGFARRESPDDYRSGVALGALAGCFAVLVHSFFDFTLHTTANALLFLVMAALATMNGRVEQPTKRRRRRRRRMEDSGPIMISPG